MKRNFVFALFLIFLLTSCSRLDIAVNLANSYITNKADDYFDLTREQTKWLKEALVRDINTVKKTIFPQLATEMFKAADRLNNQKSFDTATVLLAYERLENLLYQGLRVFSKDAVAFADKLQPQQIVTFTKEFDEKSNELKEDPEEKFYDKIKKQFDSWAGSMTSTQKKELKKFVQKNPAPIKENLYNRQLLAHGFVKAFPDKVNRKVYVQKIFTQYSSMREPTYAKLTAEKNNKVAAFVTNLLNKMSDDQKETLISTIRDRANQLIKISKG